MSKRNDRIDPDTADFSEIRALPHFADAVYLSVRLWQLDQPIQRVMAWENAINALRRTVPL